MLENQTVIYESYVERASNQITETDYRGLIPATQVRTVQPQISQQSPALRAASYTYAGRIGYDHYVQGYVMTTNYLNMSYQTATSNSSYDVNGQYKNLSSLAALVTAALLLPGVLASAIALKTFAYFGFAAYAVNALIPSHVVSATQTTVTWRAVNAYNSNQSAIIFGSRFVSTQPGYTDEMYEADYWPVSSYASHNVLFALEFYPRIFSGYDSVKVASWS